MKLQKLCLVGCICLLAWTVTVQAQQQNELKVFLIGNSFSQNATRYLTKMAAEGGYKLTLGHAEPGGCSLQRHWDSVAVSIKDPTRGKLYNGKSLKELLSVSKWDVITLQQYSLLSADSATYQPYADKLYAFIKQLQPQAKIYLQQTWAYRMDAINFGYVQDKKRATNQKEMWSSSRAAYHRLAKRINASIFPVGDAFYSASTHPKWAFKKDETFEPKTAKEPALPIQTNSLNVGYTWKDGVLKFDPNHANEAGCYLAGMVWYASLFGKNPQQLKFKPENVSDEFAVFLKELAWKTVNTNAN